eukprot:7144529-Heterocapsa_arctica.AAC.1
MTGARERRPSNPMPPGIAARCRAPGQASSPLCLNAGEPETYGEGRTEDREGKRTAPAHGRRP